MEEKPPFQVPKKKKQTWNKLRSKSENPPPMPKSEQGKVKEYKLTPEELEYYRNLKPPIPDRLVRTTAPRNQKYTKSRGQS